MSPIRARIPIDAPGIWRSRARTDEEVAAELERSAGRARARGGTAAAAAFLQRATTLTLEPIRRTERSLAAASAKIRAGAFATARDLLSIAEAGPPSDFQQARIELIGAELAFLTNRDSEAPPLLLKAARRLKPIDPELSRGTYLQALTAVFYAGRLALGGGAWRWHAEPRPRRRRPTRRAHPSFFWMAWSLTTSKGMRPGCRYFARHFTRSAQACR